MIGQRLGSYEVVAKLGEGGRGEVYHARDTKLKCTKRRESGGGIATRSRTRDRHPPSLQVGALVRPRPGCYLTEVILTIELEREDDGRWVAEIPALSGVMCYGADRDEALTRVQALALRVIADRLDHREAPAEFLNVAFEAA